MLQGQGVLIQKIQPGYCLKIIGLLKVDVKQI